MFLSADEEDKYTVAQANAPVDENGHFAVAHVACRTRHTFKDLPIGDVDYMDVSPKQIVSVATALIPFLEHDDANRALMGSNMQKQAVPLLVAELPIVGTGMETHAARNSGEMVLARKAGTVVGVAGRSLLTTIARSRRSAAVRTVASAFWCGPTTVGPTSGTACTSSCAATRARACPSASP